MNSQQIDDLADQAWCYANYHDGLDEDLLHGRALPPTVRFHRKLAELIIRECAQVVNDNNYLGSTLGDRLLFDYYGIPHQPHLEQDSLS